jgi:hypothetical protein
LLLFLTNRNNSIYNLLQILPMNDFFPPTCDPSLRSLSTYGGVLSVGDLLDGAERSSHRRPCHFLGIIPRWSSCLEAPKSSLVELLVDFGLAAPARLLHNKAARFEAIKAYNYASVYLALLGIYYERWHAAQASSAMVLSAPPIGSRAITANFALNSNE